MQTDSAGRKWKDEYSAVQKFESAVKQLPETVREVAATNFLKDKRDPSTPFVLNSPSGEKIAIAAFIFGSFQSISQREKVIAEVVRLASNAIQFSKANKKNPFGGEPFAAFQPFYTP